MRRDCSLPQGIVMFKGVQSRCDIYDCRSPLFLPSFVPSDRLHPAPLVWSTHPLPRRDMQGPTSHGSLPQMFTEVLEKNNKTPNVEFTLHSAVYRALPNACCGPHDNPKRTEARVPTLEIKKPTAKRSNCSKPFEYRLPESCCSFYVTSLPS